MSDATWQQLSNVLTRNLARAPMGAELQPEMLLVDLGLDSMRAIDVLFDLETAFSVVFPDAMLTEETFASVGSLHNAIKTLVADRIVL